MEGKQNPLGKKKRCIANHMGRTREWQILLVWVVQDTEMLKPITGFSLSYLLIVYS